MFSDVKWIFLSQFLEANTKVFEPQYKPYERYKRIS